MSGEELRKVLIDRNIQQKDLAKVLGMSQQNFSAIMKVADVKSGVLESIAKAAGLSVAEFYDGSPAPAPANNSYNKDTTINDTQTMTDLLAMLKAKDEQINRLLALLEKLQ